MNNNYLVILEVSQKQNYIFESNKLKNNIINSSIIAWVTSSGFFKTVYPKYSEEKNMVYSGGGHTVLVFDEESAARDFVECITKQAYIQYDGLELFATIQETKGEPTLADLNQLSEKLEAKKSVRKASFSHGSFGIEAIDVNTLKPILDSVNNKKYTVEIPQDEEKIDTRLMPEGYKKTYEFDDLCISKNKGKFIAVVHIDGNAMGSRVTSMRDNMNNKSWEESRKTFRDFSEAIDMDFKESYREMTEIVAKIVSKSDRFELNKASNGQEYFTPIRRIITAGDDICFVTDGSIGVECARILLECLSKKENSVDHKKYSACAGIAIVHKNYPFFKAYELSEMLCGSAKKYIANVGKNQKIDAAAAKVSAMDWHIEFGEIKDSISEIRKDYIANDKTHMEMRPYVVVADDSFMSTEKYRNIQNFRKLERILQNKADGYANSKLKQLRTAIKNGEVETNRYITINCIEDIMLKGYQDVYEPMIKEIKMDGVGLERKAYIETSDSIRRSLFFDAIEAIDLFEILSEEGVKSEN